MGADPAIIAPLMSALQMNRDTRETTCRVSPLSFKSIKAWLAGGLCLVATWNGMAEEFSWDSVGARAGFSITSFSHPFVQSEAYSLWNLPWTVHMGTNWSLKPKLELTLGGLTGHSDASFVGTVGPTLELRHQKCPVYLTGGSHPTILSRDTFGDRDMGCLFEFTSHLGLGWDITEKWNVEYRFQHMSNAGLGSSNPGLNMNLIGVGYRF
jgi:hypothetical protein